MLRKCCRWQLSFKGRCSASAAGGMRRLPARACGSSRLGGQATALLWDGKQDGARPAAADAALGLAPWKLSPKRCA